MTVLSVFFDLTVRRIPNWIIAFGLAGGLLLNASQGFAQFSHSLLGFIGGIAVFIVPFALGWMGAGDVKYFGVVGALLGVEWLPRVLFYSILTAGVLAVAYVASAALIPVLDFLRTHGPIANLPSLASVECCLTPSVKEPPKVPIQSLGALLLVPELWWLTILIPPVGGPAFNQKLPREPMSYRNL